MLDGYKHSAGTYYHQLQVFSLKLEAAGSSETKVFTYQATTWYPNTAYHYMGHFIHLYQY